ncbi:MAG: TRAP transporter substrate-binding protein DctP [Deltaproteobacteria bacterium]|nr:TRAP transporter substrate-binding protein DctP [Deltaproteobacteria bacterium]
MRRQALVRTVAACALALVGCWLSPAVCRAEEVIKLKYGSYAPQGVVDEPIFWFFDEVSKRSGVKIRLETYFLGTLAKADACIDALGAGVYDVGWISPALSPAKTPLSMIPNATPVVARTLRSGTAAMDELVRTYPPMAAEFDKANVKYLFSSAVWHYQLISTKPVRSFAEIKGLRVRTFGYLSKAWAEAGGVPVALSIAEAYDALQKGALDGVLTQPVSMHETLKLSEIAKHYTDMDFGCLPVPVLMNAKAWNRLPEKVRKEMLALSGSMPEKVEQIIAGQEARAVDAMKKKGVQLYELPEPDKRRRDEIGRALTQVVASDLSSRGAANAKETMDRYLQGLNKYSK